MVETHKNCPLPKQSLLNRISACLDLYMDSKRKTYTDSTVVFCPNYKQEWRFHEKMGKIMDYRNGKWVDQILSQRREDQRCCIASVDLLVLMFGMF